MLIIIMLIIVHVKDRENIPVTWYYEAQQSVSPVSLAIIAAPEESSVRFPP